MGKAKTSARRNKARHLNSQIAKHTYLKFENNTKWERKGGFDQCSGIRDATIMKCRRARRWREAGQLDRRSKSRLIMAVDGEPAETGQVVVAPLREQRQRTGHTQR